MAKRPSNPGAAFSAAGAASAVLFSTAGTASALASSAFASATFSVATALASVAVSQILLGGRLSLGGCGHISSWC